MDYQQACARLDGPRKQTSKKIGHKLTLFYDGAHTNEIGVSKPIVRLQYFNTNILTWLPDGGVNINTAGFWDSYCTLHKVNEYMPRGWRMHVHRLHFAPKMQCASIMIRKDTWELVRSMPFEDHCLYYEDGRVDHKGSPLAGFDAVNIIPDVAETVEETVMAFLYGQLPRPTIEEDTVALEVSNMAGIAAHAVQMDQMIVDIAKTKRASASLIWWVLDNEYKNSFRMNQLELYEPKNYEFTGIVRSQRDRVAQMEHFLKVGHNRTRYLKNSPEFHAMKKDLLEQCEMYMLQALGFGVKEFERRPRTNDGW